MSMSYIHYPVIAVMTLFMGAFLTVVFGRHSKAVRSFIALAASAIAFCLIAMLIKPVMIDGEIRRVSASRYEGMSAGAYLSADQRAVVFWGSGGDSYFQWYVLDGILFGSLRGDSGGNIYFNGCLPEWAEDPSGGPERHDVPEINKKLWKEIPYESAVEDLQGQWTEMKKQLEEFETQKSTQK